jgi:succinyl-diaminopimelate desuccinylase
MTNAIDLSKQLIAAESVTPARGAVFDVLEQALTPLGFTVHRFIAEGSADGPVENLFAIRGQNAPHFAFAGHVDVVPPGQGWTSDPFTPTTRGELLYGRGAVDMKGAIAAFVAAVAQTPQPEGTLSLIITGDEEGVATHGTVALIDWLKARAIRPDLCLVGEPTSVNRLGDTIKIGRRGSVNLWLTVAGQQGHVAYPHLADNPAPKLVSALAAIAAMPLDAGNIWFQPSNLEITEISIDNPAMNVIPAEARARLNIRFNDLQRGPDLVARVAALLAAHAPGATLEAKISGEAFLTAPGQLSELVSQAITAETGLTPELSTSGGTSDARFLSKLCPVVEFGLRNATMHKLDEAVELADLDRLTRIYARIIVAALASK